MPRFNRLPKQTEQGKPIPQDEIDRLPQEVRDAIENGTAKVRRARIRVTIDDMNFPGEEEHDALVVLFDEIHMPVTPKTLVFKKDVSDRAGGGNRTARIYKATYYENGDHKPSPELYQVVICRDLDLGYGFISPCNDDGTAYKKVCYSRNGRFNTDTDFIASYGEHTPRTISVIGDPDMP